MSSSSSSTFANDTVPVAFSVAEIYENVGETHTRYSAIESSFKTQFNRSPTLYVRAPGRVNLIGEHIDYSGYSVLPMAIARDTVIAVAYADDDASQKKDDKNDVIFCTIANTDAKFTTRSFKTKEGMDTSIASAHAADSMTQ